MKFKFYLFMLFVLIGTNSFGQQYPIEASKVFGGYQFSVHGQPLKPGQMYRMMAGNTEAHDLMGSARIHSGISSVFSYIGGFSVGYALGSALYGDFNYKLFAVGAVFIGVGIPISIHASNQAYDAVQIYNAGLNTSFRFNPEIKIGTGDYGIGLVMRF